MSDAKVIQFIKANYGGWKAIKPNLWCTLADGKRTLFRLEHSGMLSMRFELDTHRCEWVETPGWVDSLVADRVREAEEFFARGQV